MPIKRLQLQDIPLPSAKYMFKSPHRKVGHTIACQTEESSFEGFTPASTPLPMSEHSEALRYYCKYFKNLPLQPAAYNQVNAASSYSNSIMRCCITSIFGSQSTD